MTDPLEQARAARHFRPWDDFWRSESAPGDSLPSPMAEIDTIQATVWRRLAERLPRKAKVLDIATGDGRVMAHMLRGRPDLRFHGIDLATHLPTAPKHCRVQTGIAMESLPFAKASFAGVTSQFGVEYGDFDAAIGEMARVTMPGGVLGLMLHRKDGPILAHNIARRNALRWALDDQNLIAKAIAGLNLRAMGVIVPPALTTIADVAANRFGRNSVAYEIAIAVIASLRGGAHHPPEHVSDTLTILDAKARNEIDRISSLEHACETVYDLDNVTRRIGVAGFTLEGVEALCVSGETCYFANFVSAKRI